MVKVKKHKKHDIYNTGLVDVDLTVKAAGVRRQKSHQCTVFIDIMVGL